ncbi:CU044_2847 family protein [Streptomyces sp. NPDC053427]|uniref:CU044_2847 family protein n=1 Tax=Streptomyces sp. NPDC053427 TaxID=3365701 RepID=UPI0037D7657C
MPDYIELNLAGADLRLELADVGEPPEGGDEWTPVSSGGARVTAMAADALKATLRPLGPVLQHVHDSVLGTDNPPHDVSVEFGVQIGQDLKLGIVGGSGQATMKITATWRLGSESN